MAQHTAIPWRLVRRTRHTWDIIATWHGEECIIATSSPVFNDRSGANYEEENAANGQLMATSPELLQVARAAVNMVHWLRDTHPAVYSSADEEFLEEAEAAIAKATGGKP